VAVELLPPFAAGDLLRPWFGNWGAGNRRLLPVTDHGSTLILVYTAFGAAITHGIWQQIAPAILVALTLVLAFLPATVRRVLCSPVAPWASVPPMRAHWCSAGYNNPSSAVCRSQPRSSPVRQSARSCGRACCITPCNRSVAPGLRGSLFSVGKRMC
jgi:hypothetical protein